MDMMCVMSDVGEGDDDSLSLRDVGGEFVGGA